MKQIRTYIGLDCELITTYWNHGAVETELVYVEYSLDASYDDKITE